MANQVYGVGYSKKQPADILRLAMQLDAIVYDVRYSPRSRRPEWSRKRLTEALGDRYQHTPQFGNANYKVKGGPIEIKDFAAGLAMVRASDKPVILMCVCGDPNKCHRTVVGRLLRQYAIQYTELDDPSLRLTAEGRAINQPSLL